MRPRWKGPYLVTELFNEVNAILKADGRSKRTKVVHLCKLKRCFGKAPNNSREHSINENHTINNSVDLVSPASNRIRAESQVEKDDHQLTVNGQDSGLTVSKLLERSNNKKDDQPKSSKATRQTKLPEQRSKLIKGKSTAKMSRLEEVREEELSGGHDDPMPFLGSNSTPQHRYQDEAVTSKTPRPTPKPRSQNSFHSENEKPLMLTGNEYVQNTSWYQDDAVTSKAPRSLPKCGDVPSQSEESTSGEEIISDENPGR